MNTFKKGDSVKWNGVERVVSSTEGALVYFEHGIRPHHYEECTLVAGNKFLPGDVVKLNYGNGDRKTIERKSTHADNSYEYVRGGWDHEESFTLIKHPNDGVAELIKAGKKIEAIKQHRIVYGTGLLEAKNAVEAIAAEPATLGDILGKALEDRKPKFKVGDRIQFLPGYDDDHGTIADIDGNRFRAEWDGNKSASYFPLSDIKFEVSRKAIVVRFDKGAYEPNHTPRIHDSIESATKEAERRARMNPGIAFHALAVATISTATAPTVTTVRA